MTTEIERYQEYLNEHLSNLEFGSNPPELYQPMRYIVSLGGKRMRPLLVLLAYNIFKDDWKEIVRPAMSVELFHNFSLIHDDIMDEAPLRRGKPTVHEKWDRNVAILSGDGMLVYAYDLLLDSNHEEIVYILRLFNKCSLEVCEGQQLDMNFESRNLVSQDEYLNMIRLKTAVLLGFSLELGALLAGANKPEAQKMRDFGVNMGVGFQLMDDILDVYADQAKFGKQVGGDIISNKKTFLLINALELAEGEQKSELNSWLSKENFDTSEKVAAVTELYNSLQIRALAEAKMNEYFDKAFSVLDQIDAPKSALLPLREFSMALMKREY